MGTRYSTADNTTSPHTPEGLGDLLFGRFSDASVDSVDAVRKIRERDRE